MKAFLVLLVSAVLALTSCNSQGLEQQKQTHELRYSKDGKDSVVYVSVPQANGGFTNFYLNYLLFRQLFSSGGYNSVNHYYQANQYGINSNYSRYSSFNYYKQNNKISSYSSPNRGSSGSSLFRNNSSTPKSSYGGSSSKSYSSPSRSYSSPSRSYSSPSRSYSSPSRSYSSPSRSYSSPSRR